MLSWGYFHNFLWIFRSHLFGTYTDGFTFSTKWLWQLNIEQEPSDFNYSGNYSGKLLLQSS
jgi:hypothetical protein